jgi:hypothetical protein
MEKMTEKMATPELGHLTSADYARVYEPAHDTFLFLDALQLDAPFLRARQPRLCLEVGFVPSLSAPPPTPVSAVVLVDSWGLMGRSTGRGVGAW